MKQEVKQTMVRCKVCSSVHKNEYEKLRLTRSYTYHQLAEHAKEAFNEPLSQAGFYRHFRDHLRERRMLERRLPTKVPSEYGKIVEGTKAIEGIKEDVVNKLKAEIDDLNERFKGVADALNAVKRLEERLKALEGKASIRARDFFQILHAASTTKVGKAFIAIIAGALLVQFILLPTTQHIVLPI